MKYGILTLSFTKNNIFISLLNEDNNLIVTSSGSKKVLTKGAKKVNFLSVDFVTQIIVQKLKYYNLQFLHLKFIGKQKYQRRVIFLLKKHSVNILTVYNIMKTPHNGCSLKKIRHN